MNLERVNSFSDLKKLNLDQLESLWDEVSTEYQTYIRNRYGKSLTDKGITNDVAELQLIERYLQRYEQAGLIPAGNHWVKISSSTQPTFQLNDLVTSSDDLPHKAVRPRLLFVVFLVIGLLFLLVLIPGVLTHQNETQVLATATSTQTATATLTPTIVPTETPLALMDTDRFVQDSDRRQNRNYYPVVFRVIPPQGQPRVFVVQEKTVTTSEWLVDSNPDVASWISGMVVHPVLGIPHSIDNQRLFDTIQPNTDLILRMNTGAELRFQVTETDSVARDDSSIFAQDSPGLALLLVGETDLNDLPTDTRKIIRARYLMDQELEWISDVAPIIPVGERGQITEEVNLTISDIAIQSQDTTSRLTITVVADSTISQDFSFLAQLESTYGLSYMPERGASPLTTTLSPNVPSIITIDFGVSTLTDGIVLTIRQVGETQQTRFALDIPPIIEPRSASDLHLEVKTVRRTAFTVEVDARLYNPTEETLSISADDVWWVTGYIPNPVGPHQASFTFAPLTLSPNSSQDVSWHFNWNGSDPYAALGLLGRHYTLTLDSNHNS